MTKIAKNTQSALAEATHVEYAGFRQEIASLPVHAAVYLMQYGFAKSLQDSVAGRKKELEAETISVPVVGEDGQPVLDAAGVATTSTVPKHNADGVTAILKSEMADRVESILDGTIGSRGPGVPRLTPRESMIQKVVRDFLTAQAAKKNAKLPKVGAGYAELAEKYLTKFRDKVETEADRRLAAPDTSEEFDFS